MTSQINQYAIVIPGQGSQKVGMLADLIKKESDIRQLTEQLSDALGWNMLSVLQDEDKLNRTEFTQPALLFASYVLFDELKKNMPSYFLNHIACVAGHSLGEYSALVAAQSLDLMDAVSLVHLRGRLMAKSGGNGRMAAILGLGIDEVEEVCEQVSSTTGQTVSAANHNSSLQIVISGEKEAVLKAGEMLKAQGAKRVVELAVSVASHCDLMKEASEKFAKTLQSIRFNPPQLSVIHNVDVQSHQQPSELVDVLTRQLYQKVRWHETMEKIAASSATHLIECGPGQVLINLAKRSFKTLQFTSIDNSESLKQFTTASNA